MVEGYETNTHWVDFTMDNLREVLCELCLPKPSTVCEDC